MILEQGGDLLVAFPDYDARHTYTQVRVMATGYYVRMIPDAGVSGRPWVRAVSQPW